MNITYIYHSRFLIETNVCYYLFDYYRKQLPNLDPEKPIFVFASHFHQDHYNKKVFTLLKQQGMKNIHAILSKDISKQNYPDVDGIQITRVTFHQYYELPYRTELQTLHSTDSGVAFFVTCPEGTELPARDTTTHRKDHRCGIPSARSEAGRVLRGGNALFFGENRRKSCLSHALLGRTGHRRSFSF